MSVKTLLLQAPTITKHDERQKMRIHDAASCFFGQALGGQPDEAVDAQSRIKPPTPSSLHCLDTQQQVLYECIKPKTTMMHWSCRT